MWLNLFSDIYLSIYIYELLLLITKCVIKMKSNIYSVEVLSQLSSCNGHHPVDAVLVSTGGCWFTLAHSINQ